MHRLENVRMILPAASSVGAWQVTLNAGGLTLMVLLSHNLVHSFKQIIQVFTH